MFEQRRLSKARRNKIFSKEVKNRNYRNLSIVNQSMVFPLSSKILLSNIKGAEKSISNESDKVDCKPKRRLIVACKSISIDRESILKSKSIRRKQVNCKLSNIKNFWEKVVKQRKEIKLADPDFNRTLTWKKVNNPENMETIKKITWHMTKEKAKVFKQLFRSIIY